jgi:hypothetical protein
MNCFEHNGNKCISINGKDYFLLRGYKVDNGKFIFVQVAGKTPPHKEDMPTKDWEIIQTKAGSHKVWTAYKKGYFKYDSDNENPELAFVGATTRGSYFLALRWLARKCHHAISDEALYLRAGKLATSKNYQSYLSKCQDIGGSGEDAVAIRSGITSMEEDVIQILKGGGK